MNTRVAVLIGLCATMVAIFAGIAWAMDEAILTPTNDNIVPAEEQEFSRAMGVWYSHRYDDGEKLLREFSKKHPDSRWAAEADLHVGCLLTFKKRYNEARSVFEKLIKIRRGEPDNNIHIKAKLRLGNIAEREAKLDEAVRHYTEVLRMNPRWDQFKYANYHARKLIMTRGRLLALIRCGPVALAACLDALGKASEAEAARDIKPTEDGISLVELQAHAKALGVESQAVEMPFAELGNAPLPVIAYVERNHYVAVLGIGEGKAQVEDSIQGRHEESLAALERVWAGKALVFAPGGDLKPLSLAATPSPCSGCWDIRARRSMPCGAAEDENGDLRGTAEPDMIAGTSSYAAADVHPHVAEPEHARRVLRPQLDRG